MIGSATTAIKIWVPNTLPAAINMEKLNKSKPSLESLLAEKKVFTGKEVIQKQKAKEEQLVEFAKAVEFESRNKRVRS